MLFNSLQFAIFFAVVLLLHRSLPPRLRGGWLLAASLVFYSLWIPVYALLLVVEIGVNYTLLRAIAAGTRPRLALASSIGFTLGLLAWFKYAAFLVETSLPVLEGFGLEAPIPTVLLPLGISFFSFQIVGLAIDVYRRQTPLPESLARYALFISFFPQLIAGPILRGSQLLPQLATGGEPLPSRSRRGVWLIASGAAKKVVLADFLLAPIVDDVFAAPGAGTTPLKLLGLYGFAFQIYFDFSGYTDMARGLALLLGFELPLNFAEPYLSRNPSEFWRRWHITLSTWLRDYLYIPLGGNRGGGARTYTNLILTMLVGGLWHGASWSFVVWGGLHGLLLALHRPFRGRTAPDGEPLGLRDAPKMILLFHVVCLLWVFFRADDFDAAQQYLGALVTGGDLLGWPVLETGVVFLCAALHILERRLRPLLPRLQQACALRRSAHALEGAAIGTVLGAVIAVAGAGGEFIYFQF